MIEFGGYLTFLEEPVDIDNDEERSYGAETITRCRILITILIAIIIIMLIIVYSLAMD